MLNAGNAWNISPGPLAVKARRFSRRTALVCLGPPTEQYGPTCLAQQAGEVTIHVTPVAPRSLTHRVKELRS